MKQFELKRQTIPVAELLRRPAQVQDTDTLYDKPGVYTLDGKPAIIYGKLNQRYDEMLWACRTLGYSPESRSTPGGALSERGRARLGESAIFGYRPRVPFGANYCSSCSAATNYPAQHSIICEFGQLLDRIYTEFAPEVATRHSDILKRQVDGQWVIPGTRFTSGIVNKSNPLRYHYDKGNFEGVMSCMVVFKKLCLGGDLSVPEFNARWSLEDHSFFLFDGQSYLHGVTPLQLLNSAGYRYSVVYYSLKKMAKCGTLEQEIARCRAQKREREQRRSISGGTPAS